MGRVMDTRAGSRVVQLGAFRFDRHARKLWRRATTDDWEAVALGSRAGEVLAVLTDKPGEVVSRDSIMDAVWPAIAVEPNNLTVQIAALRRVLDEGRNGESCIQTVPGRGYRLLLDVTPMAEAKLDSHPVPVAEPVEADLRWSGVAVSLSPVHAADPPPTTSLGVPYDQAERRQITALACELIVSSGQTEPGNLEDMQEAVSAFRQCISEKIRKESL